MEQDKNEYEALETRANTLREQIKFLEQKHFLLIQKIAHDNAAWEEENDRRKYQRNERERHRRDLEKAQRRLEEEHEWKRKESEARLKESEARSFITEPQFENARLLRERNELLKEENEILRRKNMEAQSDSWGSVYVLTGGGQSGSVKIGFTNRPVEERAKELNGTGNQQPFSIAYVKRHPDAEVLEKMVHAYLSDCRVSPNREFFSCTVDEAIDAIRDCISEMETVNNFV